MRQSTECSKPSGYPGGPAYAIGLHTLPLPGPAAVRHAASLNTFLRNCGRYPLGARSDIDTYPVFAEVMRNAISPEGQ